MPSTTLYTATDRENKYMQKILKLTGMVKDLERENLRLKRDLECQEGRGYDFEECKNDV